MSGQGTSLDGSSSSKNGGDLWFYDGAGSGAGASKPGSTGSGGPLQLIYDASQAKNGGTRSQPGTTGSTALALENDRSSVTTVPLVHRPGSNDGPGFVSGVWTGVEEGVQFFQAAEQDGDRVGQPLLPGKPGSPVFIVSGSGQGSQVVFDGSALSSVDEPGNLPPGPSRTWTEFLYEVYLADSVTVYGNTFYMDPLERGYTVIGFFIGNLVGVRGVSDAFSPDDAADAHEQSGAERTSDGVFGAIGLVCTALPFVKPVVSASEAGLAKLARGVPANATGAAAGAGQIAGSGDDIARAGSAAAGGADDVAGVVDDIPVPLGLPGSTAESVADKLRRYLLNPNHPEGGSKADWFRRALGYTQDNIDELAKQIKFDPFTAVATQLTPFGQKYEQVVKIVGANGKSIDVLFIWIRNSDGVVRLVTSTLDCL